MAIRSLSKPLQEKAEKELNEIPNQLQENLEMLRNWLSKQPHLKYKDDDQLLVNFLRGCKFSIERAKKKLDAYYTFRTIAPEVAKDFDPLDPFIQTMLKIGFGFPLPLPYDDPTGAIVVLVRPEGYDPDEITAMQFVRYCLQCLEMLFTENDNFVISGVNVVFDLKGLHYKTAIQSTPTLIRKAIYCLEKAYPLRMRGFYFINSPSFYEPVLRLIKRFLSKKLATRLHIYSTNNLEVYKEIPKHIWPTEYGGEAGSVWDLSAKWKTILESNRDKLLMENNYYSDESKRVGVPNTLENVLGIEGTFRKLEID